MSDDRTVAIVLAYNDAPWIQQLVQTVKQSGVVHRVLVVDDGSQDNTADLARQVGAEVLRIDQHAGKGAAMLAGFTSTKEPIVLFLDPYVTGFKPGHVARLVHPVVQRSCVMTIGMRDYGHFLGDLYEVMPKLGTERAVLRAVLDRVPRWFWDGNRAAAGINAVAKKMGRVCDVWIYGATTVMRWKDKDPKASLYRLAMEMQEALLAMREAEKL
jgi:glycosyltransferase involved in cell wall biosynthesis